MNSTLNSMAAANLQVSDQFSSLFEQAQREPIRWIQVKIEEIKSKVGNLVTNIRLPKTVSVGKGLFGV